MGAGLGHDAWWLSLVTGVPATVQDVEPDLVPFWRSCEESLPGLKGRAHVIGQALDPGLEPGSHDGLMLCESLQRLGRDLPTQERRQGVLWLSRLRSALSSPGRAAPRAAPLRSGSLRSGSLRSWRQGSVRRRRKPRHGHL